MEMALSMPSIQSNQEPSSVKIDDDVNQSAGLSESSVTCIYQVLLNDALRNIVISWSKASQLHTLTITIENLYDDENHQSCQIDFQSWQFWSRKGLKSLNVDDQRIEIFWDFRAAKFSVNNPQPCTDYYVALVFEKQMVLLLGDLKAEAYKRTMSVPSPVTPIMLHKEEILIGTNSFYTRVLFDDGPTEHSVVIENSLRRPGEPELRVRIDGRVVVRVMNLNWRFRGNETVLVSKVPVQIFWDVHDWLFCCAGSGHGLFIFKPGSLQNILLDNAGDKVIADCSPTPSLASCCHFIFAVKVDEGG